MTMNHVTVPAYAKVNLTLDITGIREDGYHLLRSIMHETKLCDTLCVEAENAYKTEISVYTDKSFIPCDERNTMYKAAAAFCDAVGRPLRISVRAEKRIPVGAGLGGGSADAAAVLKALNGLTNAGISTDELCRIGLKVGADVPFCVVGGTAIVTGIGEGLEIIPRLPPLPIVICKPGSGASTPVIYREYDNMATKPPHPNNEAAEDAAKRGDIISLCGYVGNVLTPAASLHRPEIPIIKRALKECGAIVSEMSGSGSSVFGVFKTEEKAKTAAETLERKFDTVILTSL